MRFAVTQKSFTFVLALVAALPLIYSGEISLIFRFSFALLWITGWFIVPKITSHPSYRRAITILLLLVTLTQVIRVVFGIPMAMGAMELISALLGAKLVDRASASDDYQIALLSFIHMVAATVTTDELLFGICAVLFIAAAPPTLAMIHLRQEMEQRFGPNKKQPNDDRSLSRLFLSKRIITRKFLVGASLLSIPIWIVTTILFITFPRIGLGLFGRINSNRASVGFGDTVKLDDLDISALDNTIMVRLEPINQTERPYPEVLSVRLRVGVLEKFDGSSWSKNITAKKQTLPATENGYLLDSADRKAKQIFDVFQENLNNRQLALPEGTGRISLDYVLSNPEGIRSRVLKISDTGEIEYEEIGGAGIRFRAFITQSPPPGSLTDNPERFLELFPDSERVSSLAITLAGEGSARDKVDRLVKALKTEYKYALKLSNDEKNNLENTALERFLFSRKSGTCEHFAAALTLMLRAVGIPARLVTGFMGADYNPLGGFYAVRQRYAHAWTEAFVDGRWTTLDAVPAGIGDTAPMRPSVFSVFFETIETKWKKWVIGYDLGTQGKMAMDIYSKYRRSRSSASKNYFQKDILIVMGLAFSILALSAFAFYFRKRLFVKNNFFSHKPPSMQTDKSAHDAKVLMHEYDKKMKKLGYSRSPSTTPDEHLKEYLLVLSKKASDNSERIISTEKLHKTIQRYQEVRFGKSSFRPGEKNALIKSIKKI